MSSDLPVSSSYSAMTGRAVPLFFLKRTINKIGNWIICILIYITYKYTLYTYVYLYIIYKVCRIAEDYIHSYICDRLYSWKLYIRNKKVVIHIKKSMMRRIFKEIFVR